MKNVIDEIKKNLTDGICLSGGNISIMKNKIKKSKYISKKEMVLLLDKQMEYLDMIEKSKNEVLTILNSTPESDYGGETL